ncbi:MAG TPA: hypothetical protein VIV40_28560 [Kofleriaceae bacterium]
MKLEDIQPAHCYARAQRVLAELDLVRDEMGRTKDARPAPEITNASPREVYFEAIAAWNKVTRLADEVGARSVRPAPAAPVLRDLKPGHVLQLIDVVLAHVEDVKQQLQITDKASEPAIEASRKPSDVLVTLIRVNRELSRVLERPFTPSDVYRTVALASAYATRVGAVADTAAFERKRKPADCYAKLEQCLEIVSAAISKRGETALTERGTPSDIQPTDVYDLANLVLGEVAFLHSLTASAQPLHAFEPGGGGHRLPAHVYQLARTLEAQLSSLR